jgi:ABC-type phosphate transport system substrate-binding protein
VGKSDAALETYYRSLVFTGKGSMPKSFASEADVVAYVAKTKGAIGYVSAAANTADAKVLEVK